MQKLFKSLAYMVKDGDPDGIELYFTKFTKKHKNEDTTPLLNALKRKRPGGFSDIKKRLYDILQQYQSSLSVGTIHGSRFSFSLFSFRSAVTSVRPLSLYILTDGAWQDIINVERPIENLVQELVKHDYRADQVEIQFIRFGDNPDSIQRLGRLNSRLRLRLYVSGLQSFHSISRIEIHDAYQTATLSISNPLTGTFGKCSWVRSTRVLTTTTIQTARATRYALGLQENLMGLLLTSNSSSWATLPPCYTSHYISFRVLYTAFSLSSPYLWRAF